MRANVAYSDSGREYLRESARVDNAAFGIESLYALNVLARKAEIAVGVVLEDNSAVLLAKLKSCLALFPRHGVSCRVLEVRDKVNQLYAALFQLFLQFGNVHAVGFKGNALEVYAVRFESVERADETGLLSQNNVALVAEHLSGKLVGLLRAACYDNFIVLGVKNAAVFEYLLYLVAQRGVALGKAVLKSYGRLFCEQLFRKFFQLLSGQSLGCRRTCGKGNHLRVCRIFQYLSYSGSL